MWSLNCDKSARFSASSYTEFLEERYNSKCKNGNYLKGCCWSPDGTSLLTASEDNVLRIFPLDPEVAEAAVLRSTEDEENVPQPSPRSSFSGHATGCVQEDRMMPAARMAQGESIYDMEWYPAYDQSNPDTCCFASTSRAHPVSLWDAPTGTVRTTYRVYDDADEVTAAYCLKFHPDCGRLIGGLKEKLVLWDLARPGRDHRTISTKTPDGSQKGIISSLAVSPTGDLIAAGSFNGVLGLYDDLSRSVVMLLHGHQGGVTGLQFSRCGNFVYSGARQDGSIFCWDVRYTCACVYSIERKALSNQRIGFDIEPCGQHLISGSTDGSAAIFDLTNGSQCGTIPVSADTVNGVSIHPFAPLVAFSTGHRHFECPGLEESDDESLVPPEVDARRVRYNRLAIWSLGSTEYEDPTECVDPGQEAAPDRLSPSESAVVELATEQI